MNPAINEFQDLLNKRIVLQNSARITETLNSVTDNFYSENPPGIETLLSKVLKSLKSIEHLLDDNSKRDIENRHWQKKSPVGASSSLHCVV